MQMGRVRGAWLKGRLKPFEGLDPIERRWAPTRDHLTGKGALEQERSLATDDG